MVTSNRRQGFRRTLPLTEKELSQSIVSEAQKLGWLVNRPWLSKFSPAGFPDLVLVRDGVLAFIELKSESGKLTESQTRWLEALKQVPNVDVFVWRPSDLETAYTYLVTAGGVVRP